MGLVVDSSNTKIFVGDRHLISRIDLDWSQVGDVSYTVTDLCGNIAFGNVEGNGTHSRLYEPRFVVIDNSDKYLYVSEALNYQIRRVDLSDPLYNSIVYTSFGTSLETNGIALSTAGDYLFAIATVLNGIWRIPIQSSPVTTSGSIFLNAPSTTPLTGVATSGQLYDGDLATSKWYSPGAVTIDDKDNLYVMDQWASARRIAGSRYSQSFNYAIRRVSTAYSYVTTIAGKFCYVSSISNTDPKPSASCYADGNGTVAGISKTKSETISSYLAAGKAGDKLFFTDYGNNVVRKVLCGPYQAMAMLYGECFHPTYGPTFAPTADTPNPTNAPSKLPTFAPTAGPSVAPTFAPTKNPTYAPTQRPTRLPTLAPTFGPTQNPTLQPTVGPSQPPTFAPSKEPTVDPTFSPTHFPLRLLYRCAILYRM